MPICLPKDKTEYNPYLHEALDTEIIYKSIESLLVESQSVVVVESVDVNFLQAQQIVGEDPLRINGIGKFHICEGKHDTHQ